MNVRTDDLKKALAVVKTAVNHSATLQILSFIKLKIVAGRMEVVATNLETVAVAYVSVQGDQQADEIVVPARAFTEWVALCDAPDIQLDFYDSEPLLSAKSGISRARFIGKRPDLFPAVPTLPTDMVPLSAPLLHKLLTSVIFCAGEEGALLSGIQIRMWNDTLTMAATDGFALAEVQVQGAGAGEFNVVLPVGALRSLYTLVNHTSGELMMGYRDMGEKDLSRVFFADDDEGSYLGIGVRENFPDYSHIWGQTNGCVVKVNNDLLQGARRIAYVVSDDITDSRLSLQLTPEGDGLGVGTDRTNYAAVTEVEADVQGAMDGERKTVRLNTRYVGGITKAWGNSRLRITMNSAREPVHFSPDLSDERMKARYVVMPMAYK
ncbi:MAG: hypothetical protein IAE79_05735 [Anaerolinea sp.]|nr:hypothetical protein [Anaerolinea sp.]